jgi:replicative DNA helicase
MSEPALMIPPNSIDAERALLGCILRNTGLLNLADISRDDFYRHDHRQIFNAMKLADAAGRDPDMIVTAEQLDSSGELENVGGVSYLSELTDSAGLPSNLTSYAEVVRNRAILRKGITVGHEIAQAGFSGDVNAMQALMVDSLSKVSGRSKDVWTPLDSVRETLDRIDRVKQGEAPGLPFGIESLDSRYKSGMKGGDLIVIGARPAMGKTAVAINIALKQECAVGFVSLEMPHDQLTQRSLSIMSKVPYTSIDQADMTPHEWDRLAAAASEYSEKGLNIFDLGGATIAQVCQAAMKWKQQQDIGLLVIDYAQLINGDKSQNRNDEIGEITRQLKSLAKRLKIPIILLAQLNRQVEARQNKRPMMSDLRESGQIEQDADMIIFLYRDAIYNDVPDDNIEFIVEKVRNGPIGFAKSGWDGKLMMLSAYDRY